MSNVIKICLPKPSSEMILNVKNRAQDLVCDPDKKRWMDEFHHNKINAVLHHFDSPEWLTELVQKEYQKFFPRHRIGGMLGIMTNAGTVPACLPPHCDRSRAVGLNYFIELGGSQVRTVFYDRVEKIVGVGKNLSYDQLTAIEEHVFEQNWYCYNVNRYHSVENIESTRLFLAIRLVRPDINLEQDFEYTMADFQRDCPELCDK